jgi:hypothetical protein
MSSPVIDSGIKDLLARIADLEALLADAAALQDADRGTKERLRDARANSESIVDTVREPLLVLDSTPHVRTDWGGAGHGRLELVDLGGRSCRRAPRERHDVSGRIRTGVDRLQSVYRGMYLGDGESLTSRD